MTKSTSKKVRCMSCGEDYHAKKPHACRTLVERGTNTSEPQRARSNKLAFGKGGKR